MNTKAFIHELSLEGRPVRPLAPPAIRFAGWLSLTAVVLAAVIYLVGPRPDAEGVLSDPAFFVPAVAMGSISICCSLSAFVLARPDDSHGRWIGASATLIVLVIAAVALVLMNTGLSEARTGYVCIWRIFYLSLAPGVVMFVMLKSAAPFRPYMIGLMAAMGSLAVAAVGVQFLCRQAALTHVLFWHFLPVAGLALLGLLLGRVVFR